MKKLANNPKSEKLDNKLEHVHMSPISNLEQSLT
jgi:hypothetical protein